MAKKKVTTTPAAETTAAPPPKPRPFAGQRWAFFGDFAIWPAYHRGNPATVAFRRGATVVDLLDETVDFVVFGDERGTGRSEAKRLAERLVDDGGKLKILDEVAYRELVRIDLAGKRFCFVGGFDCAPGGLDDGLLAKMVERAGGVVTADVDASLDYLVSGNRKGPSKIKLQNVADKLIEGGAPLVRLDETGFLQLVRTETTGPGGELDFSGFLSQLYGHVDEGKLGRALDMLRKDRYQLYAKLDDQHLVGVVRSQTSQSSVYASWITPQGHYGCAQPDLEECMGLQGAPCKHLLVLIVGLARAHQMPMAQALAWIRAAKRRPPRDDHDLCAETFLQYKGAEAGEIDWRPTETIPEDFYAM
ncbi:MAG: hypothetical protein KF773_16480 [Deltaproteobacteria bacterium]|nr:hypothetical protein [Deltaproteobacteria bacterium]